MKGVQCYELFGGIALKNHTFSFFHIVLAYLMLFAALSNAVCLYNASFFANDFCNCFLFSCFVLVY